MLTVSIVIELYEDYTVLRTVLCTMYHCPARTLCKPKICNVYDKNYISFYLYFAYTRKIQYLSVYLMYPCLLYLISYFIYYIYCMSMYINRIVNLFEFS